MKPLLNQIHVDYVLSDFTGDRNRFDYLLGLLEGIDPFERRWFLPNWPGADPLLDDEKFVEERLEQQFGEFRRQMIGHRSSEIRECSLVFMYVSETLNVLRRLGCPLEARKRAARLLETIEALKALDSYSLNVATRDSVLAKLEEMLRNTRADAELFRGRYELFCTRIAARLINDRFSHSRQIVT